jgi:hypothetical protein
MHRMLRSIRFCCAALASLAPGIANAATLADCPFLGSGDPVTHGFYVLNFQGATLGAVTLGHAAAVAGERTITLTARQGSYSGPIVGTATVTRDIDAEMRASVFEFGSVPAPTAWLIAFTQTVVAGDPDVTFDAGVGPCSGISETEGTTPPLDAFRRASVGLSIAGSPAVPGDGTVLSCPFSPDGGGDRVDRGFYVDGYPGVTLGTVTLRHSGTAGPVTLSLTARLNSYDGPVLGTATVSRDLPGPGADTTFPFGNLPVPAGSRVTFTQTLDAGTGPVFYDTGFGPCEGVTETADTTAPLSEFRRAGVGVRITGAFASAAPIPAVEYFHEGFGHYFMTAQADEIAGLDGGAYGGAFARTDAEFRVLDGPVGGAVPVCRFFTVAFAPKSSHFYTADPVECEGVKANPNWQYEKIAFYTRVPAGGACPTGTVPVYRMYNDGQTDAPNHRFTTDPAVYDVFTTSGGWLPEGARFCAPL